MIDLNERAKEVHAANHKWWHDLETGERLDRNLGELLMLVISEIAEAMEGERKDLMDTHLPHRKMAEVEMADAYIRLLDIAAGFGQVLENHSKDDITDLVADFPTNKGEYLFRMCMGMCLAVQSRDVEFAVNVTILMIMAYCEKHGYDLEGAYREKMAYNATRHDHSVEARREKNGKKW